MMFENNKVFLSEIVELYKNREDSDYGYFDYVIISKNLDKVRVEFRTGRKDGDIRTLECVPHTALVIDEDVDNEFIIQNFTYYSDAESCEFEKMLVGLMYHKPKVILDVENCCIDNDNVFRRYTLENNKHRIYQLADRY